MIDNVTGIILAGGKSSRMGEDKAFLPFPEKSLIEILIDKLSFIFKDLIIITNKLHLYEKYGIKTYCDILKERGPLGGIYTGLVSSEDMHNFIVACDMPFLNRDLIQYMLGEISDYDVVIPERNDRLHPLCAVYSKNCIKPIEKGLSKNNLKITDFLKYVKTRIINEKEIAQFDLDNSSFVNINTPKDYCRLKDLVCVSNIL